jgi:hypothetical protein
MEPAEGRKCPGDQTGEQRARLEHPGLQSMVLFAHQANDIVFPLCRLCCDTLGRLRADRPDCEEFFL